MTASALDEKILHHFPGAVVRKDLVSRVRGNAAVPSYVLEYLLGQYAATGDAATIESGIETVRKILAVHYVHRNEHMRVKSTIRDKGRHRIIDKVTVSLNEKADVHEAEFENLQIKKVIIDDATVRKNPKLLVGGVWCICDIEYSHADDHSVPWMLGSLKPIQVAGVDYENYLAAREEFSTEEWIDLLMQSMGLNPEKFSERGKLIALTRLIPFVERNYNLVELGPKGTGKSHVFSEFSPNGILISGGEVTVAKLFVNNSTGHIGLVGYWDCVAFDEFAANKRADQNLVNVMKNYLANKSFSRGASKYEAEASMAFIGNTTHTVPYMLKRSDLFDELPAAYRDAAWLDRIHHYLPGWEVEPIRAEMFSEGYGFVVDYLAEILRNQRTIDYSDAYEQFFSLDPSISTRDRDGIKKTFSGLMKLIHPSGTASADEMQVLLEFAIEGRKRVKDSILRIDPTMRDTPITFQFSTNDGTEVPVETLEEKRWPELYRRDWNREEISDGDSAVLPEGTTQPAPSAPGSVGQAAPGAQTVPVVQVAPEPVLTPGSRDFKAGQTGVTYRDLFGDYLKGATKIVVIDPYIRLAYQLHNAVDFLVLLCELKSPEDEIEVHFKTTQDKATFYNEFAENFEEIADHFRQEGIEVDAENVTGIHDRSIIADNGWRIDLGMGLDIWERPNGFFNPANRHQEYRRVRKNFSVHYRRTQ